MKTKSLFSKSDWWDIYLKVKYNGLLCVKLLWLLPKGLSDSINQIHNNRTYTEWKRGPKVRKLRIQWNRLSYKRTDWSRFLTGSDEMWTTVPTTSLVLFYSRTPLRPSLLSSMFHFCSCLGITIGRSNTLDLL